MSSCREIEPLFASYVDGDVSSEQRAVVLAHLDRCLPCREVVAGERTVRDVLHARRTGLRACATERLRQRCAAQCAKRQAAPGVPRWRRVVPLSLAATLVLAVAGLFVYSAVNQVEALAAQFTADHVKCSRFGSPSAGDPVAAAGRWVSSNGWPITVPKSAPSEDLEFLTVRRCLVTDGRTAHLMYNWRGAPLSVFVLPEAVDELGARRLISRFGHEAVMWSSGGRTYVVVARGARAQLEPVVRYVRASLQ